MISEKKNQLGLYHQMLKATCTVYNIQFPIHLCMLQFLLHIPEMFTHGIDSVGVFIKLFFI